MKRKQKRFLEQNSSIIFMLMDDCGQECAPFDIPEGFIPVCINLHLGKRIN